MITTALIIDHHKYVDKRGEMAIEIKISHARKTYYINTGVRVRSKNFVAGQVIGQMDAPELNQRLGIIFRRVQTEVNNCLENGKPINVTDIKRKALDAGMVAVSGEQLITDFIEEQEKVMRLKEGTIKHYRTLRYRLTEWGQMLYFDDVTTENLYKFDAWLHQLKKPQSDAERKAGKGIEPISDGGVYTYHKCLKAILNRAKTFKRIAINPYDDLRGKFKRGDKESVEYLTEGEMQAIESCHPLKGSMMASARDLFVFQMHTGLAYADTQAFDFSQYYQVDGRWCTVGHRVKNGQEYVIQLSEECERILKQYGWKLPKLANSDYNKCLKALGAAVGIDKRIHSHLARHSFGTKMAASDVAIQNVKKMMGHKNIQQTLRYAKALPESVFAEFRKVEEKDKTRKKGVGK